VLVEKLGFRLGNGRECVSFAFSRSVNASGKQDFGRRSGLVAAPRNVEDFVARRNGDWADVDHFIYEILFFFFFSTAGVGKTRE
jgi:hypothetical protein